MAGSQRYVRYILITVLCLILIWFISASPDPRARLQGAFKSQGELDTVPPPAAPQQEDLHPDDISKLKGERPKDIGPPIKPNPLKEFHAADQKDAAPNMQKPPAATASSEASSAVSSAVSAAASSAASSVASSATSAASSAAAEKASPSASEAAEKSAESKEPTSPKPADGLPPATAPGERMNATFVTLARNSDVWEIAKSIRHIEDRFNDKYHYDWVFLNDKEFDGNFKKFTSAMVSGKTHYGVIPTEHWSFPDWIDQDKAAKTREEMARKQVIYGDSVSYRHMCRYESGFFFRHELMLNYEWYWRVEPSIELFCDIDYDPFKFMAENKKKYSFVISLYEYKETIETLWDSVKGFIKEFPQHIMEGNNLKWISEDNGETYNNCHFWSNFEIGNLNWLRSQAYIDYFTKLDQDGGFFYERWGDAPVHSIAASLMLKKEEIHFFNDIAYYHVPFTHCPTGYEYKIERKCMCKPEDNFDWNGYSCTKRYYEVNDMKLPEGWGEGH